MSRELFERVIDVLPGMLPESLAHCERRAHGAGAKVWWTDAPREHYEAQLVRSEKHKGPLVEIGFHAEYPDAARNERVVADLTATGTGWRKALGRDATKGAFFGAPSRPWRRISEVWTGLDLGGVDEVDDDLAIEIANRLSDYIVALEPIRRR